MAEKKVLDSMRQKINEDQFLPQSGGSLCDEPKIFPKVNYQDVLVSFESGHYKAFKGEWKGDSVWAHFETMNGKVIHVNKDKVEYIQTEII